MKCKLKGFPEYDWHAILRRQTVSMECGLGIGNSSAFFKVLLHSFIDSCGVRYVKSTQGAKILFYQTYIPRPSSRQLVKDISDLVDSDFLAQGTKRLYSFHPFRGIMILFFYLLPWYMKLLANGFTKDGIFEYLLYVEILFHLSKRLERMTKDKSYNLLVLFCDAYADEAFVSQFFQRRGVRTASLQHGAFNAWRENEIINSGVELRCFNSDYLLCWNQMTVEEGLKCGISPEKLVVVGIVGYISGASKEWVCPHNGRFGVVIGHKSFEEENLKLIETANIIARKTGLNYYLKLHPIYEEHYFDDKIDQDHYIGVVKKGIPISEYADMVDFSIVGSSSVYVELVFINHDVIRYSSGSVTDKFRDVKLGKVITGPEQAIRFFEKDYTEPEDEKEKLFSYLCGYRDVRKRYLDFFRQYSE